jgi:phosphoglycerate dehydrogenase-like enzyme
VSDQAGRAGDGTGSEPASPSWSALQVTVTGTPKAPRLLDLLRDTPGLRLVGDVPSDGDMAGLADADSEVVIGYRFGPGSLAAWPRLRWLHLTGSGIDHLARADLAPDVLVTTSAQIPVTAVAEYALSGLLLLIKDLASLAPGRQPAWFGSPATLLAGSRVAVVGAGRIGRAVLARTAALGATTIAVTRRGDPPVAEAGETIGAARLAAAAPGIDHLIACLPGAPATAGLISAEVLAALPAGATVVNVGRAETIDTAALYDALRGGRLRGAFLDVHQTEPLPADDPCWDVPGLIVSPHRAFAFPDEALMIARAFLANLDDLRQQRSPRDRVPWPADRASGGT